MKIENVNEGMCQWRATNNKPCFFVNWTQDGENKYQFFSIISSRETFKQRLLKLQNN
jgi:hypothetical protein